MKLVRSDQENGCEKCWAARGEALGHAPADEPFVVSDEIAEQFAACPHNPPEYARSILLVGCPECGGAVGRGTGEPVLRCEDCGAEFAVNPEFDD